MVLAAAMMLTLADFRHLVSITDPQIAWVERYLQAPK
jgi:hypothetical protein